MVDPHRQRTTLEDGARPSKSVASSHKSRAGSARNKKCLRGRKGEMGDGKQRKQRKQHVAHRIAPTPAATAAAAGSRRMQGLVHRCTMSAPLQFLLTRSPVP